MAVRGPGGEALQRPIGLILLSILLGIAGQYLFKSGMSDPANAALIDGVATALRGGSLGPGLLTLAQLLLSPLIFSGLACYSLSSICWLAVLSKAELSFAYPLLSISYVAILLLGWLAFDEVVTALRWMGILMICVGITAIYSEELFIQRNLLFASVLAALAAGLVLYPRVVGQLAAAAGRTGERPMGLILTSIALGLVGQYLFKAGMSRPEYQEKISRTGDGIRAVLGGNPGGFLESVLAVATLFLKPYVTAGTLCYVVSTFIWLKILSVTDLSFAYPMLSIGYVVILMMGWVFFHEHVTRIRWFGVGLICLGIATIHSERFVVQHGGLFAALLLLLAGTLMVRAHRRIRLAAGTALEEAPDG